VPTSPRFRPDIEGLRAVAVLIVVLYHLGVPGFAGGYVGVDVFFVLSGFLITGLLVSELESTGSIALTRFFTRRLRRLLPASTVVLVATLGLAWVLLPPLELTELRPQALVTAGYLANVQLALSGTDYLQAHTAPSALQHYWSLAVEEQFYLLWPLLLLGVTRAAHRRGRSIVRPLLITTSTVTALSLALSVAMTPSSPAYAYFLLPTRAWEMAAGGILALVLRQVPGPGRRLSAWSGAAGLAAIALATLTYSGATVFPGWTAILPVFGTLLLLYSGSHTGALQRWLSVRSMMAIGRRSYAIYLWHWPLFVFTDAVPEGQATPVVRIGVLAFTFVLAWLTFRLVENPVRHHHAFSRRPSVTYAAGAFLTVIAIGAALHVTSPSLLGPAESQLVASGEESSLPVPSKEDGKGVRIAEGTPPRAAEAPASPGPLRPSLRDVRDDIALVSRDGCHRSGPQVDVDEGCEYGDPEGPLVVLFGDSHAAQWFPALHRLADVEGWRLVSLTKSACPAFEISTYDRPGGTYEPCDRWRAAAIERINAEDPAMIVLTSMITGHGRDAQVERLDGLAATLDKLQRPERVVVLEDSPHLPFDPPVCLSEHLDDPARCAARIEEVAPAAVGAATREVAQRAGAEFVATRALVCGDGECAVVRDRTIVYRDPHHLTETFVLSLTTELARRLESTAVGATLIG
jgi:peptidoglycan/LPS O-acetylase OafA/YrhL